MAEDSVRSAGSVPTMGGFAGHHAEEQPPRPRPEADEGGPPPRRRDEVDVRHDAVAAMLLLRERVLACTRQRLGLGAVPVAAFAEIVAGESVEAFVSRLLSDQNQLFGRARSAADRQRLRRLALARGVAETRELLAGVGGEAEAAVDRVAAELERRLGAPDADPA